jgi:hypothetical protein
LLLFYGLFPLVFFWKGLWLRRSSEQTIKASKPLIIVSNCLARLYVGADILRGIAIDGSEPRVKRKPIIARARIFAMMRLPSSNKLTVGQERH